MIRSTLSCAVALLALTACNNAIQSTTGTNTVFGKQWHLVELNEQKIQPEGEGNSTPFMQLNDTEKQVNGKGGCNSFFGSFEMQGDNEITFSQLGSTKMACPENIMQVEYQFFQALEETNNFQISSDTLILTTTGMSPIAKFIAASN